MPTFIRISLICGTLLIAAAAQAAVTVVGQGKATGRIVVPQQATAGETFAAEEIQTLVQKMSGAKLEIVKADQAGDGPAILVGNQPGNKEVIDELNKVHPETPDAFAVVGKANRLSLVGRSEDSTIWAAWQWLNDQGVVFVMPGEHGTYAPQKATIELSDIHDIQAPAMKIRGGVYKLADADSPKAYNDVVHGQPAWRLFTLRMRINENTGFAEKDRFVVLGAGHSYGYYLPVSKYFKAHPEWYNLINGKRQNGKGWQLCFTNEVAAAEFAKNVDAQIKTWLEKGVPIERISVSISPNDNIAMCQCDNCRKLLDKNGSSTSMVTNFANMVTADIRKTYPKAMTRFYAYDNYSTPPDHVTPGPGVIPELCFWTDGRSFAANHAHPMFSEENHKYRDGFRDWAQMSEALTAHTYYGHYNWFTPWPMVTQMSNDLPIMASNPKFEGMYSELHPHWGTQALTLWLYPKLMWNPKLDVQAAIKTYCQAAYGQAGDVMQAYYQTVQDSMDRQGYINGRVQEISHVLTPEVVSKVDGYIAQAEGMLDHMDPDTRWRTELVCRAWRVSAQFADAVRLYDRGGSAAERQKILALCDQVDQFAGSDLGKWAFAYNRVVVPNVKVIVRGLKVNLAELPTGKQTFSDSFNMGGAIKFFADLKGFQSGMWGYTLPGKKTGEIDLPLKAVAGHRITSASVKWSIPKSAPLSATLSIVSDKGDERVLTKDVEQMTKGVDIPADVLGANEKFHLKLSLSNTDSDATLALTACKIQAQVE
jgi:hypothetical protein